MEDVTYYGQYAVKLPFPSYRSWGGCDVEYTLQLPRVDYNAKFGHFKSNGIAYAGQGVKICSPGRRCSKYNQFLLGPKSIDLENLVPIRPQVFELSESEITDKQTNSSVE